MKETPSGHENVLMQRLQQNNEEALASLMAMFYDDLYNYAARFKNDDGLIKDCIQEVFISLWQRRETAASILSPKLFDTLPPQSSCLHYLQTETLPMVTKHW